MTDIERADDLDHLTTEQLEEQAFGPAPQSRSIRGLVQRPTSTAVSHRVKEPRMPLWKKGLIGVAALAVGLVGLEVIVGDPTDRMAAEQTAVEAAMEAERGAMEAAAEAQMEAAEAEMEAMEAVMEAEEEAMEAAIEAQTAAMQAADEAMQAATEAMEAASER